MPIFESALDLSFIDRILYFLPDTRSSNLYATEENVLSFCSYFKYLFVALHPI